VDCDGRHQDRLRDFVRALHLQADPLRTVEQIRTDILKLEQQTEGLLHKIVGAAQMAGKQTLTGHWYIGML
jgi:hypothetical protein